MSNCDESELISAYIDNELTDGEISTLELHLEGCRACREDVEEIRETKLVTAGAPTRRAPADLTALLIAQANAARAAETERRRTGFPAWAGGLAAAATMVIWVGVRHSSPPAAIPMETLLAAHHRPVGGDLHAAVRSAAVYSDALKRSSARHDRS